jgi:hypothetical protein
MTPSTVDACVVYSERIILSIYWGFLLEFDNYIVIYVFHVFFSNVISLNSFADASVISLTNKCMQIQQPTEWYFYLF